MAKTGPTAAEPGQAADKPSGVLGFVMAMLIATVVSGVGGGLFGLYGIGGGAKPEAEKHAKPAVKIKQPFAAGSSLKVLSPIVTNLAGPRGTWIRLESAIVLAAEAADEEAMFAARIAEDTVAYLRTVTVAQIEGASGFQNLREDLNDRARVRTGGKVREVIIQSLIVE